MSLRVLADHFLFDLAKKNGPGVHEDSGAYLARIGARLIWASLPGLDTLATTRAVYMAPRAEAHCVWIGIAQLLLLRAAVGHSDRDVLTLAADLRDMAHGESRISTRFP